MLFKICSGQRTNAFLSLVIADARQNTLPENENAISFSRRKMNKGRVLVRKRLCLLPDAWVSFRVWLLL